MSPTRLSSYISCPVPPAPAQNSNAGPATQPTRRSPIQSGAGPPQRWSFSQGDPPRGPPRDPARGPPRDPRREPPRRESLPGQEWGAPPPPAKTRPTLPSTDETPPTLPGDLYFQYQKADVQPSLFSSKKTSSSERGGEGCLLNYERRRRSGRNWRSWRGWRSRTSRRWERRERCD